MREPDPDLDVVDDFPEVIEEDGIRVNGTEEPKE